MNLPRIFGAQESRCIPHKQEPCARNNITLSPETPKGEMEIQHRDIPKSSTDTGSKVISLNVIHITKFTT